MEFNLAYKIFRIREELHQLYEEEKDFLNPKILEKSIELDNLIIALINKNTK